MRHPLRVEELERRDTPAAPGVVPGFPAPLATSGPFDGVVTLFPAAFGTGQFVNTQPGFVTPFPGFAGTVRTAFADVNGDLVQDLIAVTGPGAPVRFAVLSGTDFATYLVPPTDPFGGNFTGGGFVAGGDIDRDGRAEIVVTPDTSGGPRVVVFSVAPGNVLIPRANFFGIADPGFRGGARPAVGDFNADGFADLAVAAGPGGGPRIAVYNGRFLFASTPPVKLIANDFFAFTEPGSENLRNGVYIAAGDVDGDGFDDLVIGAGAGGGPRVIALSGRLFAQGQIDQAQQTLLASFFVGDVTSRGGVRVAAKDIGVGTRAEIITGSGVQQPSQARAYLGRTFTGGEPAPFQAIDPYGQILPDGVYVG